MAIYPFNGVVLVDKPAGLSSHDVVAKMRRNYRMKKVGHTGSLDPLATGMLPVCLGQATKYSQFLLDADKYYTTTACLGQVSDTGDAEGKIVAETPLNADLDIGKIQAVLAGFLGQQAQVPPMHSAIKHQGMPLYKLARKGQVVERQPRQITIHQLELVAFEVPHLILKVQCSKGTYIRSLVEDIGTALGCGAHITALHRDWVHPYQALPMTPLADIRALSEADDQAALAVLVNPIDSMLQDLSAVHLSTQAQLDALYFGQSAADIASDLPVDTQVRIYRNDATFIGVGIIRKGVLLQPKRLLVEKTMRT